MFQTFFYEPIFNLVIFLYNTIPGHDLGVAIIALTIIIKLALWSLSKQQIKAQKSLQDLQPKIEEIKSKHANDKEAMSRAMLELYKEHKVNPLASCLPLLIQLPFLIAVFSVFRAGFTDETLKLVYSFIVRPETVNTLSFGFLELAKPNVALAVLAGLAQFWQTKMMMTNRATVKSKGARDEDMMAIMNKQMMYMMPILTIFFGLTLPGGLSLYWFVSTLLTGAQQVFVFNKKQKDNKVIEGEVVE